MKTRLEMMTLVPMHSVGAEIGVFTGRFSAELLAIVRPVKLYLVDTFATYIGSGIYDDGKFSEEAEMRLMPDILRARFDDQPVEIIKSRGDDWMLTLKHHLDWVYIDSSHAYDDTVKELAAAFQAVKPGGYVCGHDWHLPDVRKAVAEFCQYHKLEVSTTTHAALPSWMIQLNK